MEINTILWAEKKGKISEQDIENITIPIMFFLGSLKNRKIA